MNSKKIRKWLREIHRDMGYFFVGVILIYGFSGLLLNHDITAYSTSKTQIQVEQYWSKQELTNFIKSKHPQIKFKKMMPSKDGFQIFLEGGIGEYHSITGELIFETYKRNVIIDFAHRLHYNTIKGWKYMADFFAVSLIFFAISGLFLSKGKKSVAKRGKWFVIAGIAITFLIFYL